MAKFFLFFDTLLYLYITRSTDMIASIYTDGVRSYLNRVNLLMIKINKILTIAATMMPYKL